MGNPPRSTTTKLWIGVGAYALIAGSGLPTAPAEAQAPGQRAPHSAGAHQAAGRGGERGHGGEAGAHGGHGGEAGVRGQGGEGGEAGALAGLSPEAAYAAQLALIRGHLSVGRELAEAGAWDDAIPHFLHPTEEIYEGLAPQLQARGVAPFREELVALARAVRSRADAQEIGRRRAAVEAALDRAGAALPAATRDSPAFVAEVVPAILRVVAEEYETAIEDGRFANAVEYQDSRGFLRVAEAMLRGHERALRAKNAQAFEQATGAVKQLSRAWPAVRPPERPVLPPGEVSALVSRAELAAGDWR